jgi:hypothetical protein
LTTERVVSVRGSKPQIHERGHGDAERVGGPPAKTEIPQADRDPYRHESRQSWRALPSDDDKDRHHEPVVEQDLPFAGFVLARDAADHLPADGCETVEVGRMHDPDPTVLVSAAVPVREYLR